MEKIIHLYIRRLGIKNISERKLNQLFQQHPLKNSVRCVKDILDQLNIPNIVCYLDISELQTIDSPCMVMLNTEADFLCTIEEIDSENIILRRGQKAKSYTLNQFAQLWTGVVIGADKPNSILSKTKFSYLLDSVIYVICSKIYYIIFGLCALLLTVFSVTTNFNNLCLIIISSLGIINSVLLITKSISKLSFTEKLCVENKNLSCNKVLTSTSSLIFNWVSLSELSISYFIAQLVVCFSFPINRVMIALSSLSLAVVVFSVLWQYLKKQWCILCMATNLILCTHFGIIIYSYNSTISPNNLLTILMFSVVFVLVLLISYLVRLSFENKAKLLIYENKHSSLLAINNVIDKLTYSDNSIESCDNYHPITNQLNSQNCITLVTNLSCPACSALHSKLNFSLDCNINIIFVNFSGSNSVKIASLHIIAVFKVFGWNAMIEELTNWFNEMPFKYKISDCNQYVELYNAHQLYALKNRINATPSVYVNNKKLPEVFSIKDLEIIL